MSQHQFFRRSPVPQEISQQLQSVVMPATTRGIILNENEAFMQPGGALVCDNWKPTMKGLALRGGHDLWCQLPETTPVISAFEYVTGTNAEMYACNATKIYNVTTATPAMVVSGQTSGNHVAAQFSNAGGEWLIVVNDAGDPVIRYDGTTWAKLAHTTPANWAISTAYVVGARARDTADSTNWKCAVAHSSPGTGTFAAYRTANPAHWKADTASDDGQWITGPPGSAVEHGGKLVYVCKYRGRLYFIEQDSMNAWYLGIDSVGGALSMIPMSGAASKGGKLVFCAVWSLDAGDGTDDKLVFMTNLGEIIVFTGSNPADPNSWRQEGRFDMSPPLGMNAHIQIGGDLMVATVDGIMPVSGAVTKSRAQLELAAVTRTIKPMWRDEVNDKRHHPWTMCNWHEYGGAFITLPGGVPGKQRCLVVNTATGAFARFTGWDAMCWLRLNENMFFGTQTGQIMQADKGGYDNGTQYVATLVGGWELFQSRPHTVTWRQARGTFAAGAGEPFQPQIASAVDYVIEIPPPPLPGPDPGNPAVWDMGLWDAAIWDAGDLPAPVIRNTGWVSIGVTGYAHAAIVQVSVAQVAKPVVELISIGATFERAGVNI